APMSPLTLSFPVMYAVVGFCWPFASFSNVSADAEIVASAGSAPSMTSTLPSSTRTVHWPAPATSQTYELCIPAVLDGSTLLWAPAKNALAVPDLSLLVDDETLADGRGADIRGSPPRPRGATARRRQERREDDGRDGRHGGDEERRLEVDRVSDGAEQDGRHA